jgi:hypothetical protein
MLLERPATARQSVQPALRAFRSGFDVEFRAGIGSRHRVSLVGLACCYVKLDVNPATNPVFTTTAQGGEMLDEEDDRDTWL